MRVFGLFLFPFCAILLWGCGDPALYYRDNYPQFNHRRIAVLEDLSDISDEARKNESPASYEQWDRLQELIFHLNTWIREQTDNAHDQYIYKYLLSNAYQTAGFYDISLKLQEELISDPDTTYRVSLLLSIARNYHLMHDFNKFLHYFNLYSKAGEKLDFYDYRLLAWAHFFTGNMNDAKRYADLIPIDSLQGIAAVIRSRICLVNEDYKAARAELEMAVRHNNEYAREELSQMDKIGDLVYWNKDIKHSRSFDEIDNQIETNYFAFFSGVKLSKYAPSIWFNKSIGLYGYGQDVFMTPEGGPDVKGLRFATIFIQGVPFLAFSVENMTAEIREGLVRYALQTNNKLTLGAPSMVILYRHDWQKKIIKDYYAE